jgi:hypothetical protein
MKDWTKALEAEADGDNEAIEVSIVDRNGEPYVDKDGNPAVIQVLGEYSDAVKRFDRQMTTKALRSGRTPDAAELNKRAAERCAAATTGWKLAIGGQDVPYSSENALSLYLKGEWIRDQVHTAMRQRVDFFGQKSTD